MSGNSFLGRSRKRKSKTSELLQKVALLDVQNLSSLTRQFPGARPAKMAAAVASWKSFVATTETGSGKYGPECAVLAANGMADLARAHFVECVEVRNLLPVCPPRSFVASDEWTSP